MDDKQLLAQFAAAALTGVLAGEQHPYRKLILMNANSATQRSFDIAQAMLAEFKRRTEQKGNENG